MTWDSQYLIIKKGFVLHNFAELIGYCKCSEYF